MSGDGKDVHVIVFLGGSAVTLIGAFLIHPGAGLVFMGMWAITMSWLAINK